MRGSLHRTLSNEGAEVEEKVEEFTTFSDRKQPLPAFKQRRRLDVPRTICSQTTLLRLGATNHTIQLFWRVNHLHSMNFRKLPAASNPSWATCRKAQTVLHNMTKLLNLSEPKVHCESGQDITI
jgi:hypothetical protein